MALYIVQWIKWRKDNMEKEKKIDFEKEIQRLDEIVEKISSKALPLEESLKLYEEGNAIIRSLEQALKDAQEKVEKIVNIEDK